jgi:hypothetical protein
MATKQPAETPQQKADREVREKAYEALMDSREELLKTAKKLSPGLHDAILKDYINKGQNVPDTIRELMQVVAHLKPKK